MTTSTPEPVDEQQPLTAAAHRAVLRCCPVNWLNPCGRSLAMSLPTFEALAAERNARRGITPTGVMVFAHPVVIDDTMQLGVLECR